ncbi:hypothetical protein BDP27DRAFT_1340783 [Rhodocollybia butyracea]|uniref:Uncharacterized protein n=1 Tax=Rhodocollybia butyracea TaxID=206335 RepID=A0A9P5PAC7_9AGAR|nr:hypothetical protein BDP27DRAFT_1340783 [Rhodocollybia butyracea]
MPINTRPNLQIQPEVKGSTTRFVPPTQPFKPGAEAKKQKTIHLSAKPRPSKTPPLLPSMDHALSIDKSVIRPKVEFKGNGQQVRLEPLVVKIPTENLDFDNGPVCTAYGAHYTDGEDEIIELDFSLDPGLDATTCFTSVVVIVSLYKENSPISIKNWRPRPEAGQAEVNRTWASHLNVGATLSTSGALHGNVGRDKQLEVRRFDQPDVAVQSAPLEGHRIRWIARPQPWDTAVLNRLVCSLVIDVPLPLIAKVRLTYEYQVTPKFLSWSRRQKEKTVKVPSAESPGDIELELCQSGKIV